MLYRFVQQEFANKLLVDGGDEERVSTALSHHPQYTNVVGVLQRDKVLQHCKVRIHHHIKSIEPATGIPVSGWLSMSGETSVKQLSTIKLPIFVTYWSDYNVFIGSSGGLGDQQHVCKQKHIH